MSLDSADLMGQNARFQRRVRQAIRQKAYEKRASEGAAKALAASAIREPQLCLFEFIQIMQADSTITDFACSDCGYSHIKDESLLYVVHINWDVIAEKLFGVVT